LTLPAPERPIKGEYEPAAARAAPSIVILEPSGEILLALSQNVRDLIGNPATLLSRSFSGLSGRSPTMTKSTGSKHNGLKRRIASRHFQDAECFRIPKNSKIFVSVAVENDIQNESQNSGKCIG
jgi:hypothetical protein